LLIFIIVAFAHVNMQLPNETFGTPGNGREANYYSIIRSGAPKYAKAKQTSCLMQSDRQYCCVRHIRCFGCSTSAGVDGPA